MAIYDMYCFSMFITKSLNAGMEFHNYSSVIHSLFYCKYLEQNDVSLMEFGRNGKKRTLTTANPRTGVFPINRKLI